MPMALLLRLSVCLSVCLSLAAVACAQYAPDSEVVKSDIPLIKCAVCERMVDELLEQVEREKEKAEPKKVEEMKVIEIAEKICSVKTGAGGWIRRMDMVEDYEEDVIKLVDMKEDGDCASECKTIERACQMVMGDHDTDVAELLYRDSSDRTLIFDYLCTEASDACTAGKPPPLPKDRKPGETWQKYVERTPDYAAMAREMGVKESVMHDEATIASMDMPKGRDPPPEIQHKMEEKHFAEKNKKEGKKKKKQSKKGGSSSGGGGSASKASNIDKVLLEAQEVAKKGGAAATEWVNKLTTGQGAGGMQYRKVGDDEL